MTTSKSLSMSSARPCLAWVVPVACLAMLAAVIAPGRCVAQQDEILLWSTDDLQTLQPLQETDLGNVQAFQNASSLSDFLGLRAVESIHMPVPLNFVFVGFAGDGNMGVNFTAGEMQRWFGHLDHVLPHSRIELSELTCAEDGYCAGIVQGELKVRPLASAVHLNFSCHVTLVKQRSVMAAFERAIHVFSRPIGPTNEMAHHQVDSTKMEAFVDHFVSSLGLAKQYTVVVINPTWSTEEPQYGYRQGLSEQEIAHISDAARGKLIDILGEEDLRGEPALPAPLVKGGEWTRRDGRASWSFFKSQQKGSKFQLNDAAAVSDEWASAVTGYLKEEESYRAELLRKAKGGQGAGAVVHAVRVLRRMHGPMAELLRKQLFTQVGDKAPLEDLMGRFRTMHPAEDCLVSNWVGHKRWMLIDLTAATNDWGPALGGEGAVHQGTTPRVETYFAPLAEERKRRIKSQVYTKPEEQELEEALKIRSQEAKARTSNEEYKAFVQRRQAARAPGAAYVDHQQEVLDWNRKYQEALARAELNVLEEFALKNCHQQQDRMHLCTQMKEQVDLLRSKLVKLSASGEMTTELFPSHMWDIFGVAGYAEQSLGLVYEGRRAHDLFMAQLAGLMSRGIRHVLTPPSAVWRHEEGEDRDTANLFSPFIIFEIFSIYESVRTSRYESSPVDPFPLEAFKEQVNSLLMQDQYGNRAQNFMFRDQVVDLTQDAELAAAFAVSLRTSMQQVPVVGDADDEQVERVYIDSRELSHHVKDMLARRKQLRRSTYQMTVPVLIFHLNRDVAVLVDEHHNAKATEDMILVVQNAARETEHPTGFMCNGVLVSRPLSSLKEALAAVLLHLGGVLPPHLGYNPGRRQVVHDWLWSVGAHPLSATSTGLEFSEIQKDALARNYLLDALDSSIDTVNRVVSSLKRLPTSKRLQRLLTDKKAQHLVPQLRNAYNGLLGSWRSVVDQCLVVDYASALGRIKSIQDDSRALLQASQEILSYEERAQCPGRRASTGMSASMSTLILGASSAVMLASAVYAVFPLLKGLFKRSKGGRGQRIV